MPAVVSRLGVFFLLFEIVMIARVVLDWTGVLASGGGGPGWAWRARGVTHAVTEPVIAPVRRVLRPVRVGSVSIDLAFTAVFVAVLLLRTVVVSL